MPDTDNPVFERRRGDVLVSTDPARLDMEVIYGFLSRVYWSEGIPRDTLERALRNSLCFGVYVNEAEVGFARAITDRATFAYLADVFILETHRGRGLSKLLMEAIMAHPDLQGLRRFSLSTRDAHGLYRQFGFESPRMPDRLMEILDLDVYKRQRRANARRMRSSQSRAAGLQASGLRESVKRVLFVCVGNACRSQMAEAFANHLGQGSVRAWSAGSAPLGWIAPETYTVMQEKGLSLDGQWSKGVRDVPAAEMDVVVGMGCEVSCPVPAGFKGRVIEWSIPDPFTGEVELFRAIRDLIETNVRDLIVEVTKSSTSSNLAGGNGV